MPDPDIAAIVADPQWLAHRYDRQRDEIHFAWLPRERHRSLAFLTRPEVAQAARQAIPRTALAPHLPAATDRLNLILHSGLTGSTQLTHAFDRPGTSMALSEPPILTDVVSFRLAGASEQQTARLLDEVVALLARPFAPGEAVIVKMGSIGNTIGGDILARCPSARALCLHAPLPLYLASVARKGLEGRIWARKLFGTLRSARLTDIGFTDEEFFEHTDLQIAADAWLILHRVMGDACAQFGDRVAVCDSESVIARPATAIAGIARHFGIAVDAAAVAADPSLARHSKTGEAFDPESRMAELHAAMTAHGDEIDRVVSWTQQVAQAQRIAWTLPGRSLT